MGATVRLARLLLTVSNLAVEMMRARCPRVVWEEGIARAWPASASLNLVMVV